MVVEMKRKTAVTLGIPVLFHYQSMDKPERIERIFNDRRLYFSSPSDFNDPWDCRPCFGKAKSDEEAEKIIAWFVRSAKLHTPHIPEEEHVRRAAELRANRPLLDSIVDQATTDIGKVTAAQYRVYCLTRHPDSELMWSHYARSHTGVCLEFSVKNALVCAAMPIDYLGDYPILNITANSIDANLLPLFTKSAVWGYEDEFRLVATEHPAGDRDVLTTKNGFIDLPTGALQAIIVGATISAANRRLVESLVEKSKGLVKLKEARIVKDKYAIEIHHVT